MIFFISPSKKLQSNTFKTTSLVFEKETQFIQKKLKNLTKNEVKIMLKASDTIVNKTYDNYQNPQILGASLFSYVGEAFKSLDPYTLSQDQLDYCQNHLLIGSAYYGLSKPFSLIHNHRLDFTMNPSFKPKPLNFFKPLVTQYLKDKLIINCASKEYSQLLDEKKLKIIHVEFYQHGKINSVLTKQARGKFIRQCCIQMPKTLDDLHQIKIDHYSLEIKENRLIYTLD